MSNLNSAIRFAKQLLKRPMRTSEDIQLRMLQHRLLSDLTYRLPKSAKRDLFIGFKEWKRILSRKQISKTFEAGESFVLVSTSNQIEIAKEYISANTSNQTLNVLVREELSLPSYNMQFHLLALRISLKCLFDSKRVNLALVIREVVEWTAIVSALSENNSTAYFDFTPFEKDSNALAYFLMEKGIHVTKIPSPGPLSGHHTFMVADAVVLSSAYQLEELPSFKHFYVKSFLNWPPEQYMRYASHYANAPLPPKNTIGFYSHGEWIRRKAGHADFGMGIQENEVFLLNALKTFLEKHSEFQLIIFPHPKERQDQEFEKHYNALLRGTNYSIAPSELKSSENFFKVNIGLMAYSTLLFERLSLGYKTFIGTNYPTSFPLEGSPLKNLCLSSFEELESALLLAQEETEKEFFARQGLEKYPLTQFLTQKVAEIQK
ncbi:MAG: hypothetical protein RI989_1306 [Bacteroidota bacterium]